MIDEVELRTQPETGPAALRGAEAPENPEARDRLLDTDPRRPYV